MTPQQAWGHFRYFSGARVEVKESLIARVVRTRNQFSSENCGWNLLIKLMLTALTTVAEMKIIF